MDTDGLYQDDQPTFCQIDTNGDLQASLLLAQASEKVKPIMTSRNWCVRALKEFNPNNPNLLGLNLKKGDDIVIYIRLRMSSAAHDERSERHDERSERHDERSEQHDERSERHDERSERHDERSEQNGQVGSNPSIFYSFEHILEVLLHQLAHIEYPDHDVNFYKLLEEITNECNRGSYDPIEDAYTQLSPEQLRALRLRAFEKRQKISATLSQSPDYKGGFGSCPSSIRTLSPQDVAIFAGIQRERDDVWCNEAAYLLEKPPTPEPEPEPEPMQTEHTEDIDLSSAMEDLAIQESMMDDAIGYSNPWRPGEFPNRAPDGMMDTQESWTCSWCTLANNSDQTVCSACQNPREGMKWNCSQCTYSNPPTANTCMVCTTPK